MTTQHPFDELISFIAQQLTSTVEVVVQKAVREELDRREQASASPLPPELTAKEAAAMCRYKSTKPLRAWHYNGLTPITRGRALFYATEEVVKLKKQIMR